MYNLGMDYGKGGLGLPVDQGKCIELLRESAGLGHPDALSQLGYFLKFGEMGLDQDEVEALKNWEKAAEGGDLDARYNLGNMVCRNGNYADGMRHWRLSASVGHRRSIIALIVCFDDGLLHHAELAKTLQTMYVARAEMKTKDRDRYIQHLKRIGEYEEEYDF
jgi:TPR repeat protein